MENYLLTNAIKKSVLFKCANYLERALIPLFQKEGWDVFRLGKEKKSLPGVTSYDCSLDSDELKQVFAVRRFDLIVYDLREKLGVQSVMHLEQLLQLAAARHSGRILLLSGADVFAADQAAVEETAPLQPDREEGKYLAHLEALALSWKTEGLPLTILRFPDLCGPGMEREDSFLARYLYACAEKKTVPVYEETEMRDFLSVRDAAYAVFQTYERGYRGNCLHVSGGQPLTYRDFFALVRKTVGEITVDARQQGTFAQACLDPDLAKQQVGWQARNTLADDLPAMYQDICCSLAEEKRQRQQKRQDRRRRDWKEKVIPYAENAVGAFVMLGLTRLQQGQTVNGVVPFDFNFLYIAVMGLLYGRRQAFLAVGLSCIILFLSRFSGFDFGLIAVLYQPEELLHFLSYLVMGVLTGYLSEQAKFREQAARWQHLHDIGQYRFLQRLFQENVRVKDKMYRQIVNSRDSMGRIYHIVSRLDSVEPENIYNQTALVTAEILDVSQVIIYAVGRNTAYLRQKVRLGNRTEEEPHSLKIEEYPYLQQLMQERRIFVNRDLLKGVPDLAAPIVYGGRVIAVIQIYQLDFDKWSIYELNLLAVTSRLVASSLARAYAWEEEVMQRRCLPATHILKEKEFNQIIRKMQERCQMQAGYSALLARVDLPGLTYEQIDRRLAGQIRMEDYAGLSGGAVWLLFPDVDMDVFERVKARLQRGGVPLAEAKGVRAWSLS